MVSNGKDNSNKLIHLPTSRLTPEVVLHRTLNKVKDISAVAVVIKWNDNTMEVDWSCMAISELCMASMVLDNTAQREMTRPAEDEPDGAA